MTKKLLLVTGILVMLVMILYKPWTLFQRQPTVREIALKGYADNDTGGKVLGDPRNGERDLVRLYEFLGIYRKRHGGAYPNSLGVVHIDALNAPEAYGLHRGQTIADKLQNPDNRFGDMTHNKPEGIFACGFLNSRPDGTPLGGATKAGEKEAIAMSLLYVYRNIRNFPGERTTMNPAGVYLVLWNDGTTSRVPYDQVRYVVERTGGANNEARVTYAFPGQAGVPDTAMSYDDYYRKEMHANPPHGKEGGPGVPLASK